MQLTRAADYAVRVTMHLASLPPHEHLSRPLLAAATGVPESFLSKILRALARAGLLVSRRGGEGGFAILPRGRSASLLEVIEAIEGPIALNVCLNEGESCSNKPWCAAHTVWAQAQRAMTGVLSSAKIADLTVQSAVRKSAVNAGTREIRSAPGKAPTAARIFDQATSGNRRSRSSTRSK